MAGLWKAKTGNCSWPELYRRSATWTRGFAASGISKDQRRWGMRPCRRAELPLPVKLIKSWSGSGASHVEVLITILAAALDAVDDKCEAFVDDSRGFPAAKWPRGCLLLGGLRAQLSYEFLTRTYDLPYIALSKSVTGSHRVMHTH